MTTKDQQRTKLADILQRTTVRTTVCTPGLPHRYNQRRLIGSGPVPAYVYDDGITHSNKAVAIIH